MFIRQSIRSDFCAPYATAAFLGLHGVDVNRRQVQRQFKVRRLGWAGATHEEMAEVVQTSLPIAKIGWRHIAPSNGEMVLPTLRRWASKAPLLVTARCRQLRHGVADWHTFVILQGTWPLELVDPLGPPPAGASTANSMLFRTGPTLLTLCSADAARWALDPMFRISALTAVL